jgi:hypothetical protein
MGKGGGGGAAAIGLGGGGGAAGIGIGGGAMLARAVRLSGTGLETASGTSVHAARRARAQLAAARAAATTFSCCSADVSLNATDKNYNRFPGQSDE